MDFATFLDYHGTTIADPLLYNYGDSFDNFCQFQFDNPYFGSVDKAFIKWNREYQSTPKFIAEIPTFLVVSATSTTTTTLINENNRQTEQAVNQLVADYLDDDIQQILNIKPIDNFVNSPTSSTLSSSSSISPPPPELQSFPLLSDQADLCPSSAPPPPPPPPPPPSPSPEPTTKGKDITVMMEHETERKNKRKRTANISPLQQQRPSKRRSGRPSTNETLTKLASSEFDNNQISSQNLILRALDGSEKKKKTILTCSTENIEQYNLKQFSCYEFLGDLRKKALDNIKEQKNVLEHILYIEKMVTQNIERKKK
jgi:hypothetical protein